MLALQGLASTGTGQPGSRVAASVQVICGTGVCVIGMLGMEIQHPKTIRGKR